MTTVSEDMDPTDLTAINQEAVPTKETITPATLAAEAVIQVRAETIPVRAETTLAAEITRDRVETTPVRVGATPEAATPVSVTGPTPDRAPATTTPVTTPAATGTITRAAATEEDQYDDKRGGGLGPRFFFNLMAGG